MAKKQASKKPLLSAKTMNPAGIMGIFAAFKIVATIIAATGALDYLEEKAKGTESELDDKAIRIAKAILKIMGE